ncbi:MAG: ferrous iron transport protein B [Syntrophus sp. (in: bacteria)]|nr:ferrous iron transport protein B [Syntrophus sp. (in: bacteria)]
MDNGPVSIVDLKEGQEGIVYHLSGGKSLTSRLAGMGIVPGTRIKVMRNRGGLLIVLASDTRVALGRGQAAEIQVVEALPSHEQRDKDKERETLLVALAGQPNVGKSTVFNVLTGLSQHIGNWPGKTVEKKEGVYITDDKEIKIVDLPGTYSLSAFSEEERVARDFIINENPDVIILLVNAAALERSLYMLSELLLLGPPVIIAVNMTDVAEDQGIVIDIEALHKALRIPVVQLVATKNRGIKELIWEAIKLAKDELPYDPKMPDVSEDHKAIFNSLFDLIREHVPPPYTDVWVATKLMEGDPEIIKIIEELVPIHVWNEIQALLIKHEDALRAVVGGRYDWIEEVTRAAISRFKMGQVLITDRIDHILTRPVIGIPVLLGILGFIFTLTFEIGFPAQKGLEFLISAFGQWIDGSLSFFPTWVRGLLVNGIIGGVGSILTFVPLLIIFFTSMAFLEDVGYMARAAFVMDRFMHIIGLHGKSFLPMCLGFGCNVPAVMGARIVESKRARLLTIFLAPFVPCTGRLAAMTFIAAAIFGNKALAVSWSLVALNIVALGIAGMIISRLFLRGEPVPFIMELPLYHRPDLKTIFMVVWSRTMAFMRKAGTVILIFSVVIWFLSNIPGGTIETSVLSWIGHRIEFIGAPMGLDWRMIVALLSSIVAKENSIAALGILYDVGDQGLRVVLPTMINHASALSFLVILMVFIPCIPTITVMRQEMENWRWFLFSLIFMLCFSLAGGFAAYHIAVLLKI